MNANKYGVAILIISIIIFSLLSSCNKMDYTIKNSKSPQNASLLKILPFFAKKAKFDVKYVCQ